MHTNRLRGIVPPVVTPFTADGKIDFESLERLVDRLLGAGVHGLFALGSSGEVAYLASEERRAVLDTIVAAADGKVPVLAGAIDATAGRVAEQVRIAEDAGADAVVVTAPFYAISDDGEVADHFRTIAAATELDVWAYDIPVRVHRKLSPAMLVALGEERVLAGVKDSSGDDVSFRRLVAKNAAAGSPLTLLTGHEVVVDGMLLLGADGAVPGLGNVDPERYVRLWEHAQAGRWDEARTVQDELASLFEIVFAPAGRSGDAAGVGSFKTALQHIGVIATRAMAAPVQQLDDETAQQVQRIVDESTPSLVNELSAP